MRFPCTLAATKFIKSQEFTGRDLKSCEPSEAPGEPLTRTNYPGLSVIQIKYWESARRGRRQQCCWAGVLLPVQGGVVVWP